MGMAGLHALAEAGHEVVLVIAHDFDGRMTRPPMPWYDLPLHGAIWSIKKVRNLFRGLWRMVFDRSIERFCREKGIEVLVTTSRRVADHADRIRSARPDVLLANGWLFRIPPSVCRLARVEAVNVHPSALPEYRGWNCTLAPLVDGADHVGVTAHVIERAFDAGAILAQRIVPISNWETAAGIQRKRAAVVGDLVTEAMEVAGRRALYRANPPSPYYPRRATATYLRYRAVNAVRSLLGMQRLSWPASYDYAGCPPPRTP